MSIVKCLTPVNKYYQFANNTLFLERLHVPTKGKGSLICIAWGFGINKHIKVILNMLKNVLNHN